MGRVRGVRKGPPAPSPKMTSTFLIQLEFYKKIYFWFIGVEVKHGTTLKNLC